MGDTGVDASLGAAHAASLAMGFYVGYSGGFV
jgi:hypothetical protein